MPLANAAPSEGSRPSGSAAASGAAPGASAGGGRPQRRVAPGTRSGYAPADSQGNFAVPDEDTTDSGHPRVDFDDLDSLEHDPSERRPGGPVAKAVRDSPPQVRLIKWLAPLVVFAAATLVQSMALYTATLRLMARSQDGSAGDWVLTGATPRDNFSSWLGGAGSVSHGFFDFLAGIMPFIWGLTVIFRQDMRLWSRTLFAGSVIAVLNSFAASSTVIPAPGGLEVCVERLNPAARDHYEAAAQPPWGFSEMMGSLFWVLWLWVQDLVFGMRGQQSLVCACGFSGPAYLSALLSLSLYDAARAWVRKLKPQFRSVCHIAFALVLSGIVVVDGMLDIGSHNQYTMEVVLSFCVAALLYSSPIMAILSDLFLVHGSPLAETKHEEGFDVGDIVAPPCCLPFCMLHGRYFLFTRSAEETEESWRLHQKAARETEEARLAREEARRQLEGLDFQLKSMRQDAFSSERQEDAESKKRLADHASEARAAHMDRVQKLTAEADERLAAMRGATAEIEARALQREARARELELQGAERRKLLEAELADARAREASALAAADASRQRAQEAHEALRELHARLDGEGGAALGTLLAPAPAVRKTVDAPLEAAQPAAQGDAQAVAQEGVQAVVPEAAQAAQAAVQEAAQPVAHQAEAEALVDGRPWFLLPSVQPSIVLHPARMGR